MLNELSNQIAGIVSHVQASVVQVEGQGRPASGLVYAADTVVTTARAVGRDEHPRVRRADGEVVNAEIAGWDPATRVVVLRAPGLELPALSAGELPRVGEIAIALARSWSNAVTASAGIVSVIGGPLPTGRRRAIDQVIRTTAPMHDGFAGWAFLDTAGGLLGGATAGQFRGLGVIITAAIAWKAAADVLEHGGIKRGYLGIAGQPAALPPHQRGAALGDREEALLVVGVTPGGPAAGAGILVGDLVVAFDGQPIE